MPGSEALQAPPVSAVLLAAGSGERLGGRPKALLKINGEFLVRRQARLLCAAGCPTVVVLGARAAEARAALVGLEVAIIENPAYRTGQASSVMAGLSVLTGDPRPVLVALVDQPLLTEGDVAALLGRYAARGTARAVVPEVGGLRGNPVVVARAVVDAVLADRMAGALRAWLDAHPQDVLHWPVDNDHYIVDLDTPADVARLVARTGWRVEL
jgi:molybdenum cofactor cytidylyltransferase